MDATLVGTLVTIVGIAFGYVLGETTSYVIDLADNRRIGDYNWDAKDTEATGESRNVVVKEVVIKDVVVKEFYPPAGAIAFMANQVARKRQTPREDAIDRLLEEYGPGPRNVWAEPAGPTCPKLRAMLTEAINDGDEFM